MINIVDDSIGALIFQKETGVTGNVIVDNEFYPLALRPNFIENRISKIESKIDGPIVSINPSMSLYFKNAITGLEKFNEDFIKNPGVVLSNKLFAEKYNGVDVQILSNTVVDTITSEYVLKNLLDSYIKDEEVIYVMDSCIHFYRDFIEQQYSNRSIYFLFDYLKLELNNVQFNKNKIYVTGSRRGFYLGAEELLGGNYVSVRRMKW